MPNTTVSPTLANQLKLRTARAKAGFKELPEGESLLLVGWGLSVTKSESLPDWQALRYEAKSWLDRALEPLGMAIALSPTPIACSELHRLAQGERMTLWLDQVKAGKWPCLPLTHVEEGPYVWLGVVGAKASARQHLETLFMTLTPASGNVTQSVSRRLENLFRDSGTYVRLFGMTAFWNSLSMSRIAHARLKLCTLSLSQGPWTAYQDGAHVLVSQEDKVVLTFEFPEETTQDLQRLFPGLADKVCAPGI
jgi:hypothetical protein